MRFKLGILGCFQRKELLVLISWLGASFVGYKFFFPHAIYTYDSFFYVDAAIRNLDISYWPIGYSKFIRWVHFIGSWDGLIVIFQYVMLEVSSFILCASVVFFWSPSNLMRRLILLLVVCNPVLLIMSNYVLSDALFISLTIGLVATLIWLLNRPRAWMAYLAMGLFVILFTIRYYAVFYPVIILPVLLINKKLGWKTTFAATLAGVFLTGLFVQYTSSRYYQLIGRAEFSPFSGYRLAENAILAYEEPDPSEDIPNDLRNLHRFVSDKLIERRKRGIDEGSRVYYDVRDTADLLNQYMQLDRKEHGEEQYFKKWASMGDLYGRYGRALIKRHPVGYITNYVTKGIGWYVLPTPEITNEFERGGYYIPEEISRYFGYSTNELHCTSLLYFSITPYWILLVLSNFVFIFSCLGIFILGYYRNLSLERKRVFVFLLIFWVVNFFFSVLSSPCMFRYEIPIMITNILMGILQGALIFGANRPLAPDKSL